MGWMKGRMMAGSERNWGYSLGDGSGEVNNNRV